MTKRIVRRCIDCGNELSKDYKRNKHHFRCDRCWLEYMANYDKHELKCKVEKENEK